MSDLNVDKLNARVERARRWVRKGIKYKLGRGGYNANHPNDAGWDKGLSDCSGFISYVLGMRRDQVNAGKKWKWFKWIETTSIYRDATGPQEVFRRIREPVPGCMVVYGDNRSSQGHIGIVTAVNHTPLLAMEHGEIRVIDCASGPSKREQQAVTERNGSFFMRSGAIFCVLKEDFR